ncbi:charged multivesicular body protein 4b-like isoform X1 [Phyllopteryx taeniolatus]|uniref:charged multivesicular body protein 4b-like isoform X1 n=1 Tax=Phyllopteryx taeniolatus TaxID=161469 RepID=UPI002AD268F6|nr:charged multivesicular body protein 4b-like isoform X1 [Phyllopteryx taeniolatus]
MSLFGKWFGTGGGVKGGKAPTPQEAVQKLRETEEMLAKKQEFLEKKIEQETVTAKKHGMKNQRAALQALKRKKRYTKQLEQIDGTLSTMEFQREALENANTNTEVLKNMGFAAKAMKAAHKELNVDSVDDLMSDIMEQQELAQEITNVISNPIGFGDQCDEVRPQRVLLRRRFFTKTTSRLFRMSSWPSWRSWSRKSWTGIFWKWKARRTSPCRASRPCRCRPDQPRSGRRKTRRTWRTWRPGPPTKLKRADEGPQGCSPPRRHPEVCTHTSPCRDRSAPVHTFQVETVNVNNQLICVHRWYHPKPEQ